MWLLLQVEAMEAEMAQELQREAETRSAVREDGSEGEKAVQTGGPSLVLDEAAGDMGGGEGQRYSLQMISASCSMHKMHPAPVLSFQVVCQAGNDFFALR